jgi:lysozyme
MTHRLREIAAELVQLATEIEASASLPTPARTSLEIHAIKQLTRDESEVLHAYQDSEGYWTIGIGVLIDKRKGGGITKEESEYLFLNRLWAKIKDLDQRLPWWRTLNEARQGVLINMCFQMGIGTPGKGDGLLGFVNTLRLIEQGSYEAAADNMLKSRWASQTPQRAERLSNQMRSGEWQ